MSKIDWNLLRNGARRANDPQYQDVFDKQFELYEEIKLLRSEVEWIKDDMRKAAKLNMELMQIRSDNEAEIKKLRAEIVANAGAFGKLHNTIGEQESEIEWKKLSYELLSDDYKQLQGDIKRLRDQVTRLSTLVDTERSLHDTENEILKDEIKRLCQRLRDAGISTGTDDERGVL